MGHLTVLFGGHLPIFGVGELIEEGTLVCYMLINDPRSPWLIYEDVA